MGACDSQLPQHRCEPLREERLTRWSPTLAAWRNFPDNDAGRDSKQNMVNLAELKRQIGAQEAEATGLHRAEHWKDGGAQKEWQKSIQRFSWVFGRILSGHVEVRLQELAKYDYWGKNKCWHCNPDNSQGPKELGDAEVPTSEWRDLIEPTLEGPDLSNRTSHRAKATLDLP